MQLFGDLDVLPNYGIPMNPDLQSGDENVSAAGSELMNYQQPIDFTDFLNIDDPATNENANGESDINFDLHEHRWMNDEWK